MKPYDAALVDPENYKLTDTEQVMEKACDEERYYELHNDILTKQLYEGKFFFNHLVKEWTEISKCEIMSNYLFQRKK